MTLGRLLITADTALCAACLIGTATGRTWMLIPAAIVGFFAYALINSGAWNKP